jgi:hypothetical protein
MNDVEFIRCLCDGYVRCYRTFNLHTSATWTDVTQRELDYFCRLGESLGFQARLEHNPGNKDIAWHDPVSQNLVLYGERETEQKRCVPEALRKLLVTDEGLKSRYLLAVLGWVFEDDIEKICSEIRQKIGSRCIGVIAWVGKNKDDIDHLQLLVSAGGNLVRSQAKVAKDSAGYWFAYSSSGWI